MSAQQRMITTESFGEIEQVEINNARCREEGTQLQGCFSKVLGHSYALRRPFTCDGNSRRSICLEFYCCNIQVPSILTICFVLLSDWRFWTRNFLAPTERRSTKSVECCCRCVWIGKHFHVLHAGETWLIWSVDANNQQRRPLLLQQFIASCSGVRKRKTRRSIRKIRLRRRLTNVNRCTLKLLNSSRLTWHQALVVSLSATTSAASRPIIQVNPSLTVVVVVVAPLLTSFKQQPEKGGKQLAGSS